MSFGLCGMMTWGSKIRRRQEEGRITQTSSETHSVILDAPPSPRPLEEEAKPATVGEIIGTHYTILINLVQYFTSKMRKLFLTFCRFIVT